MDASFTIPFPKLLQVITTLRVMIATSQFCQLPKSGLPAHPAIYLIAVGYKERPIVKTTVPVMRGGKYFCIFVANIPTTAATAPPTIWAPKTSAIPNPMTIACIEARYAKETPIMTGSFAPQKSSTKVMMPAVTKDD